MNDAANDEKVKVLVVKGSGKNFCTGNDLKSMMEFDNDEAAFREEWAAVSARQVLEIADSVINFPKPLISLVQGNTTGFMFTLMAMFDVVLVTEDAVF